jgi:hypothetical protein
MSTSKEGLIMANRGEKHWRLRCPTGWAFLLLYCTPIVGGLRLPLAVGSEQGRAAVAAASQFGYVLGNEFVPYAPPPQPSKGGCLTDPDFHTTFCRVSDVNLDNVGNRMASVVYSRWTPLNSNGTYLYLQREVGSPDALIYSAEDHSLVKILPGTITIDGVPDQSFDSMEGSEIRWDYTGNHPERFYFVQDTKFLQYNVPDDTAHVIFDARDTFPQAAMLHNDVEGDSSADSRYWAWMVKKDYDGSTFPLIAIVTYDKETDEILGVMDLSKYHTYGGNYNILPTPNMVEVSPSGRKVIYHLGRCWGDESEGERPLDIGTVFDGPHAWDLDFTSPVKVSIDETHSGWAWDYEGNELFVSQNNRSDWIEARNVMTGQANNILYHGDLGWGNGFHFARMPHLVQGWILMSTYKEGENNDWGDNQLIMLETKDQSQNPRVWRLGHTHNHYDEYYAEAFAAMSQFGDRIWWGAKWPGQNNIETYEMILPPKWWEELSGAPPIESISYDVTEGVRITWQSLAGTSYTVYFADGLATTWNTVLTLTGTGGQMEWLDDGTQTGTPPTSVDTLRRFYRLGGQP